jgi:hypothetical protein
MSADSIEPSPDSPPGKRRYSTINGRWIIARIVEVFEPEKIVIILRFDPVIVDVHAVG